MDQRFQAMLGAIVAGAGRHVPEVVRPLVRVEASGVVRRERWTELVREAVAATPSAWPWAVVIDLTLASITAQVDELVEATVACKPTRPLALVVPAGWRAEAERWHMKFASHGITIAGCFEDEQQAAEWATHWGRYWGPR